MPVAERAVVVERGRLLRQAMAVAAGLQTAAGGEKAEAPPERMARRASADRDRAFILLCDNRREGVGGSQATVQGYLNVLTSCSLLSVDFFMAPSPKAVWPK